jgi:hypothetical protein
VTDQLSFQQRMDSLLDSLCATRALGPLRVLLPCYPVPNGFTDEVGQLAVALKTVRMQHRQGLTEDQLNLVISLQHSAESALSK